MVNPINALLTKQGHRAYCASALMSIFVVWASCAQSAPISLISPDPPATDGFRDGFGRAVAVDGDTVLVGMPGEDFIFSNGGQGAVHVYRRLGNSWVHEAKLIPPGDLSNETFLGFGYSVAISGDTAVIGTDLLRNKAYIYQRTGTTWTHRATFEKPAIPSGFGRKVAVDENIAVIGSPNLSPITSHADAAFVIEHTGSNWIEGGMLQATDNNPFDQFGMAVAISGDRVIVGSQHGSGTGAAYIYERVGNTWFEEKLTASDGQTGDRFGVGAAISDEWAVVGAPSDNINGVASGSVYVFRNTEDQWIETQKLVPRFGSAQDAYGNNIAISDDLLLVSAHLDGNGVVYVYRRFGDSWHEIDQLSVPGSWRLGWSLDFDGSTAVVGTDREEAFIFVVPEPGAASIGSIGALLLTIMAGKRRCRRAGK